MPGPTEPPGETSATLPCTGASALRTTPFSGSSRSMPPWASSMPRSISSTPRAGSLMSFFILILSRLSLGQRGLDGLLGPVLGAGDGLLPPAVEPLALLLAHLRLVAATQAPPGLELVLVLPEAGREPGEVRGAERRGLQGLGHLYGHAQDVRLELHHPAVGGRAAVGLEGRDLLPSVS